MSYLCNFCHRAEGLPFAAAYCAVRFFALDAPLFFAAPAVVARVAALLEGAFLAGDAPFFFAAAGPPAFAAEPFEEAVSCGFAPVPPLVPLR
jgi:hypothetical protein